MKFALRAVLLLCLAELAAGACSRIVLAQSGRPEARPSGTYRVQICRAPCDPRRVADIASGTIVLNPETFRLSSIPEPARSYFTEVEHGLLVIYAENRPNACFVISKCVHVNTYAGSSRVALTRWSPRPNGAFGFPLFQTADATYSTRFTIIGRDLVGRAVLWDRIPRWMRCRRTRSLRSVLAPQIWASAFARSPQVHADSGISTPRTFWPAVERPGEPYCCGTRL
jgi:hypothetical protein